jgi:thioredoxin-dependent peroxiredoxin
VLIQKVTGKRGQPLPEGTVAPEFTVKDQDGNTQTLSQYRAKKVLLWFYPRASTPG